MASSGRPNRVDPKVENIRNDIRESNFDSVKSTLANFGIDVSDGDGRTALINAVIENQHDFVRWLVENGADINIQDRNGFCALHFTGQYRMVEISKFLLENGADPNLVNRHGRTSADLYEGFHERDISSIQF